MKKPLNLVNLYDILEEAINGLAPIDNKDLIITVGDSGCGKSTLLNSLIFGPDSLQLQR